MPQATQWVNSQWQVGGATALSVLLIAGCGGSSSSTPATPPSQAEMSHTAFMSAAQGASPFFATVTFKGDLLPASIRYTIAVKPGSASKPVTVTYSIAALEGRGQVDQATHTLKVPLYGLYAGFANQVSYTFTYPDASTNSVDMAISTPAYVDPTAIYAQPTVLTKREAGTDLGFDFFMLKSNHGPPVIVDTDGEIRWALPSGPLSPSSALIGDQFVIGDTASAVLYRLGLDGTLTQSSLSAASYFEFHHNINPGKTALLVESNTRANGVDSVESTIAEMNDTGQVLQQWDLAQIIGDYMQSQGDDPSGFVRPGIDWFHSNAAIYDARDDSLIVSSRENFVMKLDYATGAIKWIFGDPTKYWYSYPSLRQKALTLAPGGLYPIGQHALSIDSSGNLMLFNDGFGSTTQPAGAPAGESRTYSAVSSYAIDPVAMTATEVSNYDHDKSIFSYVCSSVYEGATQSLLVDYTIADATHSRLVGLNANRDVVFDLQYPSHICDTAWNAVQVPLDNLQID